MIRTQTKKRLFVGTFLIWLLFRYVLSAQEAVSFSFFKAWTVEQNVKIGEHYVRHSLVDDTAVGTIIANISLGEGSFGNDPSIKNALHLFTVWSSLIHVDVLDLAQESSDPKLALSTHLKHVSTTIEQIAWSRQALIERALAHQQTAQECLTEKKSGDQLFFAGAQQNLPGDTQAGLELSVKAAPCYITNRIYANAYSYLADKVSTHAEILRKRQYILEQNMDALLQHKAYLETDMLNQLNQLKKDLNSINHVDYEEFSWIFNFALPYDITSLPRFQKIFFDPGEIPTYLDPGIGY
jgi:hypothetical protein